MKPVLHFFLLVLLGTALCGPASAAAAFPATSDFSRVDTYIEETMRRFPIPGLSLAIVQGDQILYMHGYGTANTQGDPVTAQTPFLLASVTKTFTALAAHQLDRAGKLDLDGHVQSYIPEFRLADSQAAQRMTVRQLLDHTSGISNLEGNDPYLQSADATLQSVLAGLARYRPQYQPGEHYEYSNMNYALLSEIVSRASGESYAEYVQRNILDPLEMKHASLADYHTLPGAATGNLFTFGFSFPYDEPHVPVMLGVGYLSASAEDMAHYMMPFFNGGQYRDASVLPAPGPGWYDSSWNWHSGTPAPGNYDAFSGGHNTINTHMQLRFGPKLGVAVLMNTRLENPIQGATAYDIATDIARISLGDAYAVRSNLGLYGGWALLDAFVLAALASLILQATRLKRWAGQLRAYTPRKRSLARLGLALDMLVGAATLMFPYAMGTSWRVALANRPDLCIPLLVIGFGLCGMGLLKAGVSLASMRSKAEA